jgi:hypothetical protein
MTTTTHPTTGVYAHNVGNKTIKTQTLSLKFGSRFMTKIGNFHLTTKPYPTDGKSYSWNPNTRNWVLNA